MYKFISKISRRSNMCAPVNRHSCNGVLDSAHKPHAILSRSCVRLEVDKKCYLRVFP